MSTSEPDPNFPDVPQTPSASSEASPTTLPSPAAPVTESPEQPAAPPLSPAGPQKPGGPPLETPESPAQSPASASAQAEASGEGFKVETLSEGEWPAETRDPTLVYPGPEHPDLSSPIRADNYGPTMAAAGGSGPHAPGANPDPVVPEPETAEEAEPVEIVPSDGLPVELPDDEHPRVG